MAKMIMVKPSNGDKSAALFSDPNSSSAIIADVPAGTMLKVIGTEGKYYTVEYDGGMKNELHGGVEPEGTIVAYPSAPMYSDTSKTQIIGNINNGTYCEIIDDLDQTMFNVKAMTTEGMKTGYVEIKYVYCNYSESTQASTFSLRRTMTTRSTKTIEELAREVISNKWGVGSERKRRLTEAGYDYTAVQNRVNELMGKSTAANVDNTKGTVVNTSSLRTRSGPGLNYSVVGYIRDGYTVIIHETKNGWHRITATQGTGDISDVWVSGEYIQVGGTNTQGSLTTNNGVILNSSSSGEDDWGAYISTTSTSKYTANDEYYRLLADKYAYALGFPPRYNEDIDVQYTGLLNVSDDLTTTGTGRVVNKTLLSNPSILSICPGDVKMFPNLFGAKEDSAFAALRELASGNNSLLAKITDDDPGRFSGKLYKFVAKTAEYAKYLNALCRATAIMLGVGDELMPGTSTKLKNFDYEYWTIRKAYNPNAALSSGGNDKSIFREFVDRVIEVGHRIESTAIDDRSYINFFLNGTETSITETMTTGYNDGPLAGIMNEISNTGAMLHYFTSSGFDTSDDDMVDAIKSIMGSGDGAISGLMNLATNFLSGGRMVLPKQVEGSTYDRTIVCNMKFVSPYGHKCAIFLNCIVPICHILAMTLPKQMSDNMYTFPFLVKCMQLGNFHCDLGVITSLEITRGGSEENSWTVDTLSTEWEVTIGITPLVNNLMMTSSSHPLLFCKNEMLLSYLSNFCGFDMLANNIDTKLQMTKRFFDNVILDIPRSIDNKISDALYNKLNSFFNLSW